MKLDEIEDINREIEAWNRQNRRFGFIMVALMLIYVTVLAVRVVVLWSQL